MRKTYRKKKDKPKIIFKKNQEIKSAEVFIIDVDGTKLGVMSTRRAIELAEEKGFDLVEVSPKANPPVAKFDDYGKFVYQKEKIMQKQKAKLKKVDTKGIRLSLRIGEHDMRMKKDQAKKFLEKGHKAKIELALRGREYQYAHQGKDLIKRFVEELKTELPIETESPIEKQGEKITTIIYVK